MKLLHLVSRNEDPSDLSGSFIGWRCLEATVYRGPSKLFKVVSSPEKQFAIWHVEAPVHLNWQETGRYGSESECWEHLEACEGEQGYIFRLPDQMLDL